MRWNQLKKQAEDLFSEKVKGRVEVHFTRYRKAGDQPGRGYITLDGKDIWSHDTLSMWDGKSHDLQGQTLYGENEFMDALGELTSKPVQECLQSDNDITKALAMLDRRAGKRTLSKLNLRDEHSMVQFFFNFRCELEGIDRQYDLETGRMARNVNKSLSI